MEPSLWGVECDVTHVLKNRKVRIACESVEHAWVIAKSEKQTLAGKGIEAEIVNKLACN